MKENSKQSSIEQRIAGRKIGQSIVEMIKSDNASVSKATLEGIARALRGWADEVDPKPDLLTMTEAEAIRFENTPIDYGAHAGEYRGQLPEGYFNWLIASAEELVRYSRSDRWRDRKDG